MLGRFKSSTCMGFQQGVPSFGMGFLEPALEDLPWQSHDRKGKD